VDHKRVGGEALPSTRGQAPGVAAAWMAVGLLSVISVISWVDRLILSLLVTPIEHELGLADAQFGLLLGLGFVAVYLVAGLPIATALDRGVRKWILAGAVLVWCCSTIAAAFANSFAMLMVTRSGVAVGEAALMPAAISMISDLFPHDRRRLPTVVFMTVTILGATGAYLIGGLVIAWADHVGVWHDLSSWRLTLIVVGLLGIPPAAFLAMTREPRRSEAPAESASAASTWAHFRTYAPLYLCLFTGSGLLLMMVQASSAWLPTLLMRGYQLQSAKTGALMALTFAPASALGVGLLPFLIGRSTGRSSVLRILTLALLACALSAPFALVVRQSTLTPLLFTGALGMLGQGSVVTLNAILVQTVTPGPMRARMLALFYTIMNLVSMGIAPIATASIATHVFAGPRAIGGGLSVISVCGVVGGILFFLIAYAWSRNREFAPT
jgi:predicted MFS family arabinose efflux permease